MVGKWRQQILYINRTYAMHVSHNKGTSICDLARHLDESGGSWDFEFLMKTCCLIKFSPNILLLTIALKT